MFKFSNNSKEIKWEKQKPFNINNEEIKSRFKVLGGGCAKCHTLEENTYAALKELGYNDNVEMITDFSIIASYGVMSTPALVVDEKVISYGKVLKTSEIIDLLKKEIE